MFWIFHDRIERSAISEVEKRIVRPSISYLFRILLMNPCIIFVLRAHASWVISMWTVSSVYKFMKWICYGVYLGPLRSHGHLRLCLQWIHWSVVIASCFESIPLAESLLAASRVSNSTCEDLLSDAIQNIGLSMLALASSCSWIVVLSNSDPRCYTP